MNRQQIQEIIERGVFPDTPAQAELMETHISWVILTQDHAFKIKKPVKYPFLDFSTVAKRKYYCEREVALNRRLTQGMYLAVLPIRVRKERFVIGGESGRVVDYAVQMIRQNNDRQMNLLLETGRVSGEDMQDLARQIADFHAGARVVQTAFDRESMLDDFADLSKVQPFLAIRLGERAAGVIAKAIDYAGSFLTEHEDRFRERIQMGFVVDGHGDLHSKNIFLPEGGPAVIFDCIEFSDHFREVDVLNELAFLGMDLDLYGRSDLEAAFLRAYLDRHQVLHTPEDRQIYLYYKLYRANVRVKINALKTMQSPDEMETRQRMGLTKDYLGLLEKYLAKATADNNY